MEPAFEAIYVARQPIFTPTLDVWGYELLFRGGLEQTVADFNDGDRATSSVLADGISMAAKDLPHSPKVLVNFTQSLLTSGAALALPAEFGVVEVLEDVQATPEVLQSVRELKDNGYLIAVDDFTGNDSARPLIDLADIVKVDILPLQKDFEKIRRIATSIPDTKILLAEKVEEQSMFTALQPLGFTLFQGFFFSKPEVLQGKKLSSGQLARLQIMEELGRSEISLERIAEILSTDPSLSYRLFRYINSASFSLSTKVTTVERAVSMLGIKQIAQWLKSAILSDMNPTPKGTELAFMAVQRAKFLELLCEASNACPIPEPLFITGLFSLLDTMLGVPMKSILSELPLDDIVGEALTGKSKLHRLLMLAHSYERGYWADCDRRLKALNLDPEKVHRLYAKSRHWANGVMRTAL